MALPNIPAGERTLVAQIAAYERLGKIGGSANTEAARAAQWQKYLDKVDPDGMLPDDERERRAQHARKADMLRLSLKAAQVRRKRREAQQRLDGPL